MMWKVLVMNCCLSLRTASLFVMVVMVRAECRDDITCQIQILTSEVQHPDTCRFWVFALQLYVCRSMSLSLSCNTLRLFGISLPLTFCVHMGLCVSIISMCGCVCVCGCGCGCVFRSSKLRKD